MVRYLHSQNLTISEIKSYFETHLGTKILYQHVRNIILNPPKK
jgi:hypothetical protein